VKRVGECRAKRNVVIGNLQPFNLRNDIGQLWENFLITERLKHNTYMQRTVKPYFWCTTTQREIDYIEDSDGQIAAFEFNRAALKKSKIDKEFQEGYHTEIKTIHQDNFIDFVMAQ